MSWEEMARIHVHRATGAMHAVRDETQAEGYCKFLLAPALITSCSPATNFRFRKIKLALDGNSKQRESLGDALKFHREIPEIAILGICSLVLPLAHS